MFKCGLTYRPIVGDQAGLSGSLVRGAIIRPVPVGRRGLAMAAYDRGRIAGGEGVFQAFLQLFLQGLLGVGPFLVGHKASPVRVNLGPEGLPFNGAQRSLA